MIGVVADDITGAHDIGSMFVKSGALVYVFSYSEEVPVIHQGGLPDVVILDTDSRFDPPKVAYDKVVRATKRLWQLGCRQFYKKTCSAFRGNVGPELDGMLDALGEDFAGVVVGFPRNGRQTIDGIHYVHGVKLEDSEFRLDPVHPMTNSDLVSLLQQQTARSVGYVNHMVIDQGDIYLRREVEKLRRRYNYLIFDVSDQSSLKTIAQASHDLPVLGGSSALVEELPAPKRGRRATEETALPKQDGVGILCVAGSLMPQTLAQIEQMRQGGSPVFELESLQILGSDRAMVIEDLSDRIGSRLQRGEDVVVHTSNDLDIVEETKAQGKAQGLSTITVSRLISEALAEVVYKCVKWLGLNRLLVAGGDTSAAVCSRLGITGMRVWEEIEPGIPSCISLTDPPLFLVLKAGSFGKPDFFAKAVAHLQSQGN